MSSDSTHVGPYYDLDQPNQPALTPAASAVDDPSPHRHREQHNQRSKVTTANGAANARHNQTSERPTAESLRAEFPRIPRIRAWLFDLDGVLTPTADVHRHAWSRLFTPFLEATGAEPYSEADYFSHIDGKPRYDGVRALLRSRGIQLPEGEVSDGPEADTVHGLGNRKNIVFTSTLHDDGVAPYPASVAFLDAVQAAGAAVAVVSSSKNARPVLTAAGLIDRFEVIVDGAVAAAEGIPGKPAPDTYERAAELLGIPTRECAVVEDAESGVQAGAAGDFGLVVGVDRGVGRDVLVRLGADVVVDELDELVPALASGDASPDSAPAPAPAPAASASADDADSPAIDPREDDE